ncbi:type I-F CRISPR-associated endoribonuclease Cas6/Csy4 [Marinimicrobium agarilyticum]|uniref:type I-F CRISPR-associated endoribonuclease Cas6/Csy4 n=1 Tax=Marinimicrobium agarilyticum TaxID=306546 RepID=UPI000410FB01|nr:type I-F CRISPR-associated endoribonuclease Cas6/Csy4 [Marinimicrobium agarilyticum]
MDHYLDIQLLPDPEFSQPMLMGALYNKLHRALVSLETDRIGVSFPEYSLKPKGLGSILRIHGSNADLKQLQALDWLRGMRDHIELSPAQQVPADTQHSCVKRRQYKTNVERLRRRRMKRKGETYQEASEAIPDSVEQRPDLPFAVLRSQSTGQGFHLFVEQGKPMPEPVSGRFNSYGLSLGATVPIF